MKKFLKKSTILSLILIVGLSTLSFAATEYVKAFKDHTKLYLDGNLMTQASGEFSLNYNSRIYVPIRFVSENMNMDVNYDHNTKTVSIKPKQKADFAEILKLRSENRDLKDKNKALEEELERIKKDNDEKTKKLMSKQNTDNVRYQKAPITLKDGEFEMKYTTFIRESNEKHSQFYFEFKNESDYGINIDVMDAKFTYNKKVTDTDIRTVEVGNSDVLTKEYSTKIMSTLQNDFDDTGYFVFNQIPDDVHEGILTFKYYKYGDENNKKEAKFAIKLD